MIYVKDFSDESLNCPVIDYNYAPANFGRFEIKVEACYNDVSIVFSDPKEVYKIVGQVSEIEPEAFFRFEKDVNVIQLCLENIFNNNCFVGLPLTQDMIVKMKNVLREKINEINICLYFKDYFVVV